MRYRQTPEAIARQRELYRFLLSRGGKWTPLEQATDSVNAYPTFYKGSYHNSTARRLLTYDIRAINISDDYSMIIVTGNRGLKLGTEEDVDRLISNRTAEARRMLFWVSKVAKKAKRDGAINLEGMTIKAFLEAEDGKN